MRYLQESSGKVCYRVFLHKVDRNRRRLYCQTPDLPRIANGREPISHKAFVKIKGIIVHKAELTYNRNQGWRAGNGYHTMLL